MGIISTIKSQCYRCVKLRISSVWYGGSHKLRSWTHKEGSWCWRRQLSNFPASPRRFSPTISGHTKDFQDEKSGAPTVYKLLSSPLQLHLLPFMGTKDVMFWDFPKEKEADFVRPWCAEQGAGDAPSLVRPRGLAASDGGCVLSLLKSTFLIRVEGSTNSLG